MANITREDVIKDLRILYKDMKSKKFSNQLASKINHLVAKDVRRIFAASVLDYYNDYDPRYYVRKFSLYDMYTIQAKGSELIIKLGPRFVKNTFKQEHRATAGYIFNQMFVEGWHGGATYNPTGKMKDRLGYEHPFPSGVAWRVPINYYTEWSHERVPRSLSVLDVIQRRIEDYGNNDTNISGSTLQERQQQAMKHVFKQYKTLGQFIK